MLVEGSRRANILRDAAKVVGGVQLLGRLGWDDDLSRDLLDRDAHLLLVHVVRRHLLLEVLLDLCPAVLEPVLCVPPIALARRNLTEQEEICEEGRRRRGACAIDGLTLILSKGTPRASAKPFLVFVLGLCCCWKCVSKMSCCSFVSRGLTSATTGCGIGGFWVMFGSVEGLLEEPFGWLSREPSWPSFCGCR